LRSQSIATIAEPLVTPGELYGETRMRIVIAMMKHETDAFSPVRADRQRFQDWGPFFGSGAILVHIPG
jgi:hypothetical protein